MKRSRDRICRPVDSWVLSTLAVLGACGFEPPSPNIGGGTAAESSQVDASTRSLAVSPVLGAPMYPTATGDVVWVVDAHGDPGLHAFHADDGALIVSFGRRGDGPTEFGQVPFGLIGRDGGHMQAWDPVNQRLLGFQPRPPSEYTPMSVTLRTRSTVVHVAAVGDRIVGQTNDLKRRFVLFDEDGNEVSDTPTPFYGDSLTSVGDRIQATTSFSTLCPWPGRGFAVVNGFVGEIQYYDEDAQFVRTAEVPSPSEPTFVEGEGDQMKRFRWPERLNYVSCAVLDDELYALYSGNSVSEAGSFDTAAHGKTIHRFDWAGGFQGETNVETPLRTIGADHARRRLIGASLEDAHIYAVFVDAGERDQ